MNENGCEIILSLAFNYHDSNCALSRGSKILGALEVERLFRSKRIAANITQMELAAIYLLDRYGLTIDHVDLLVVNALNNPFDKIKTEEDIRYANYQFLGRNHSAMVVRHHIAHAGHFLFSNFKKALVASCDGGGDLGERVAYFIGDGLSLKRINIDSKSHTSTKPYGQTSAFLFDEPFSEGKLMALAGYGKDNFSLYCQFRELIQKLKDVTYSQGQSLLFKSFPKFKGVAKFDPLAGSQLAFAVQSAFVQQRLKDLSSIFDVQSHHALVIVGGAALNLELNSLIWRDLHQQVFIPPCPDDTGIAIGQLAVAIVTELNIRPVVKYPFIGTSEPDNDAKTHLLAKVDANKIVADPKIAATRILNGEICLSHYSQPEVGPRALGHRSFLTSCNMGMTSKVSVDIKRREPYRPVAPVALENEARELFFEAPHSSPFMLYSYRARDRALLREADGIFHVDNTARLQTVNEEQDLFLSELLKETNRLSGVGMLANTSLNFKGQPNSHFMSDTVELLRKINSPSFIYCPMLNNI